jgi:hypothetical protein
MTDYDVALNQLRNKLVQIHRDIIKLRAHPLLKEKHEDCDGTATDNADPRNTGETVVEGRLGNNQGEVGVG